MIKLQKLSVGRQNIVAKVYIKSSDKGIVGVDGKLTAYFVRILVIFSQEYANYIVLLARKIDSIYYNALGSACIPIVTSADTLAVFEYNEGFILERFRNETVNSFLCASNLPLGSVLLVVREFIRIVIFHSTCGRCKGGCTATAVPAHRKLG